jgi:hypothetical protein
VGSNGGRTQVITLQVITFVWPIFSASTLSAVSPDLRWDLFDLMGRRVVRWRVKFDFCVAPATVGRRLFWALIPTALIVIGAVVAIIQFVRKPSSELFLLLGFSAVLMLGLIFMTLKIPSYAQAKAFYALSAITPLCFFGALGWETTTHVSERLRFVLGTLVLVWATSSFATYWITPSVGQHLYAAKALAAHDQIDRANAEAAKAVQVDPLNATHEVCMR